MGGKDNQAYTKAATLVERRIALGRPKSAKRKALEDEGLLRWSSGTTERRGREPAPASTSARAARTWPGTASAGTSSSARATSSGRSVRRIESWSLSVGAASVGPVSLSVARRWRLVLSPTPLRYTTSHFVICCPAETTVVCGTRLTGPRCHRISPSIVPRPVRCLRAAARLMAARSQCTFLTVCPARTRCFIHTACVTLRSYQW